MSGIWQPRYALTLLAWRIKGLKLGSLYKELMDREFWSAKQWQEYQNNLIQLFVRHCYDNVPLHRQRFEAAHLHPDDIQTIDDMHKIPILTKDEIRADTEKLLATSYSPSQRIAEHTTGSTGTPLTFYGCRERSEYLIAGLWRIYSRCGWQPGERIACIWGFSEKDTNMPGWKKWLRDYVSSVNHLNAWKANDQEFTQWFKLLKKQKPTVLQCYASSSSRFARWLLDHHETLPSIKGVYCTSEKLYDTQRKQIAQAFQSQVYDMYGCGEVTHIACTCEKDSMHINPDMAVVEMGERNEVGNRPLIVTGLRNWAMPFLRYQNGDCVERQDKPCTCGRKSPLMKLQVSRLADVFTFANGKKFPSLYFVLRLYREGFDGIELFQFHQNALDHIYLRVVKNDKCTNETLENLEKIILEIEDHIEQQAKVEILYVDYIQQSSTSKHYYAKSDIR